MIFTLLTLLTLPNIESIKWCKNVIKAIVNVFISSYYLIFSIQIGIQNS